MINKIKELIETQKDIKIWFRVDDIGLRNKRTNICIDMFAKYQIPVYLAVIPQKLDKLKVSDKIRQNKNCFVFQHGYDHKNYSLNKKNEFPENVVSEIVEKNILKGYKKLSKEFGSQFLPIFCPPWYEISDKHLHIIKKYFKGVSICENIYVEGLKSFNVNADVIDWTINDKFAGEEFFYEQLKSAMSKYKTIGIVLHHRTMGKKGFDFLDEFLNYLKLVDNVSFINLL